MDIVYIDKCRYEIQEPKTVPIWYIGIYRPISSMHTTSGGLYNLCLSVERTVKMKNLICLLHIRDKTGQKWG
jgi:hypothetical protein